MRVLLQIPKNPPPQLQGNFSRPFKEFIEMCLQKDPANRPTARELLRHPFIRKAKRTNYLVELIDRYRDWKRDRAGQHSESESSSDEENDNGMRHENDSGWVETIRDKNKTILNNNNLISKINPTEVTQLANQTANLHLNNNNNNNNNNKINNDNINGINSNNINSNNYNHHLNRPKDLVENDLNNSQETIYNNNNGNISYFQPSNVSCHFLVDISQNAILDKK